MTLERLEPLKKVRAPRNRYPGDLCKKSFIFLEALELHENLLHAETQAIAAKHLDTIESILTRKEESLRLLLEAKDSIGEDPRNNRDADEFIDRVIELQKRNAYSFRKLVDSQAEKEDESGRKSSKDVVENQKTGNFHYDSRCNEANEENWEWSESESPRARGLEEPGLGGRAGGGGGS